MCMPEPAASASGFGMNVACMPRSRASSLTAGLSVVTVSAAARAGSSGRSSSNWPLAASWWLELDADPDRLEAGHDLELDLARSAAAPLEVAARVVGKRPGRSPARARARGRRSSRGRSRRVELESWPASRRWASASSRVTMRWRAASSRPLEPAAGARGGGHSHDPQAAAGDGPRPRNAGHVHAEAADRRRGCRACTLTRSWSNGPAVASSTTRRWAGGDCPVVPRRPARSRAGNVRHRRRRANSYKRLVPGYEAPVAGSWRSHSRGALIRVPAPVHSKSAGEASGPGSSCGCPIRRCNPYLAYR